MDVRFKDPKLDRLETDPTYDAGFSQAIVTTYRRRIQVIRAAPAFDKVEQTVAADHRV